MIFQGYINIYVDSIRIIRLYVNKYKLFVSKTENIFNEYEQNMPQYMRTCISCISHKTSVILLKLFSDNNDSNNSSNVIISHNKEWDIMAITDMDELYIPSIDVSSSSYVNEQKQQKIGFYDGPFFFLPYCHVYKCIVGIQGNDSIHSFFPNENKDLLIHRNEFVAFNYNRDAHYVYKCENNNDEEEDYTMVTEDENIMLKIHFIIFPTFLPVFIVNIYKKLHIWFNTTKRLFKNM